MRVRAIYMLIASLPAAGLPVGCGRAVAVAEDPPGIGAAEYDRAFDAAVEVLRDMRFVVDRRDRRFGVVTTEPLIASTIFEPWYEDNSTPRQALRSTLNLERRTVRVEIQPREAEAGEPNAPAAEEGPSPERYDLRVTVSVDRRHHPPLELTSAALGSVRSVPLRTEAGLLQSRWQPVDRDEHLERRLTRAILRRADQADPPRP